MRLSIYKCFATNYTKKVIFKLSGDFYIMCIISLGNLRTGHFEDLAVLDFVTRVSFDAFGMGNHCYFIVFLKIVVQHLELLGVIRKHPVLQFLLLLQIAPPLEPVLLHHLHRLLYRHVTSLLPLKTL